MLVNVVMFCTANSAPGQCGVWTVWTLGPGRRQHSSVVVVCCDQASPGEKG